MSLYNLTYDVMKIESDIPIPVEQLIIKS